MLTSVTNEESPDSSYFKILILGTVGTIAIASSLSIPIFIILIAELDKKSSLSDEQKIIEPLLPYIIFLSARSWLVWNFIGHRLNGQVDKDIPEANEHFLQSPHHVALGYIANISSFTNAFLVGYALKLQHQETLNVIPAILLGCLNYLTDIYIQILPAFRKHAEYKHRHHQNIMPFLKQHLNWLLDKYALNFSATIRELLPIFRGLVWTKATISMMNNSVYPLVNTDIIRLLNVPLVFLIYSSSAYSTRFEFVQLKDNLKASGTEFDTESRLYQTQIPAIIFLAKLTNGQVLMDLLKKMDIPTHHAIHICLFPIILALTSLQRDLFHNYLSAVDESQGLLMRFLLGQKRAADLAPKLEVPLLCLTIVISIAATYARAAVLKKYAHERELPRVLPDIEAPSLDSEHEAPAEVELFSYDMN